MKLIENPQRAVSVWLLGAAAFVAGLEAILPQLKAILPAHWLSYLVPAILVARLIQQSQASTVDKADS